MRYGKLLIYSAVIWLFPFLFSFLFFRPDRTMAISMTFFKSIMIVVSTAIAVFALMKYLKELKTDNIIKEALIAGLTVFAVNISIDLILVVTGFFDMTITSYFTDIGLRYVIFIIISTGLGYMIKK
jgi:hypothetical protein